MGEGGGFMESGIVGTIGVIAADATGFALSTVIGESESDTGSASVVFLLLDIVSSPLDIVFSLLDLVFLRLGIVFLLRDVVVLPSDIVFWPLDVDVLPLDLVFLPPGVPFLLVAGFDADGVSSSPTSSHSMVSF